APPLALIVADKDIAGRAQPLDPFDPGGPCGSFKLQPHTLRVSPVRHLIARKREPISNSARGKTLPIRRRFKTKRRGGQFLNGILRGICSQQSSAKQNQGNRRTCFHCETNVVTTYGLQNRLSKNVALRY